ncbi:MAG: hypothetical protein M1522_02355 [Actinobacteria bacterium]|nr:hypothetical protein [Actinomycetota bacterium]
MPNNPEDEQKYGTGLTPPSSAITEHSLPLGETASRSEVDYPLEGPVWQTIEDVVIALASTAMYPSSSTEHQREAVAALVECAVGQAIGLARVVRRLATPHGQPWAGRGWYPLLGRLDSLLVCVDPDYRITEFKEKFGCLRFHMASSPMITGEDSMLIRRLVAAAAAASREICERCGRPGRLAVRGHRYQTLCEICGPARLGWTPTS